MKRSTTSSRKARTGDRQLFARSSNQVRRRAGTFKLEPLEERTLLSVSPRGTAASPQAVLNVTNAAVPSQSPGTSVDTTVTQQTGASSLPSALAQSIKDAKTVATVTASPTTPTAAALALSSHIYTGQPQTFNGVNAGTSSSATGSVSTSSSGRSSLSNSSLAALTALSKTLKAEPQYLVLPSKAQGGGPDAGEGPGGGYTPQQIQGAYGSNLIRFGSIQGDGAGQTIAVIDPGDDPDFVSTSDPNFDASALHVFDQQFGLPDPPSFQKYNEDGNTSPLPAPVPGVSLEIALDIEWSHAIAPAANIILVEGNTSQPTDMFTAARTAGTTLGASVVSQSFGYSLEVNGMGRLEPMFDKTYYAPALAANPGLTFLAATGDRGSSDAPIYPSASPLVVGVGGTSLFTNGSTWTNETGWSGSGGRPSTIYSAPSYQQESVTGHTERTVPDVAADADPNTGVSVYDPSDGGWFVVGGTSLATPIWAGLIGIADQGRALLGGKALDGPNQTLPGLYSAIDYTNNYHDITVGNNGYPAGPGYDLVTGIGSPRANGIIPYLSTYDLQPEVISSTPAAGSVVTPTPPTTFSLTFGEPIVPSSIVASDFTVNGRGANSFTLSSNDLTVTYTFNTSPVTTQGSQTMNLPAQSVSGAAGSNLYPFSASFYYVQTQLQVTGTSPAVGSVLTVPDTDQTDLVVQFNKAFNPTTINTSDFQVSQGSVVRAVPLTSQSVDLTLSGITQDGSLTLTVPFGVILDTLGVPNAVFTGNYIVDIVSEPYPTPLQGQDPAGSLIYDPSVSGTIGFAGNTDTFTLPLAAGQTLSLVMTTAPGLIGTVTLLDPNDNVIGTATGSGPGATVVLETVPIKTAGTYSLVASGSGTTPGNYTLQAILNAAYKPATDNISTIGTAYDLTSAFTSLGTTPAADRAGVIGVLSSSPDYYAVPLTAGEATSIAIKGRGGEASIALYDSSGNLMALPTAGTGVDGIISDFIAPSKGTYYVQVTGAASLSYDLVVTRGADFDSPPNNQSIAQAQSLQGAPVALGYAKAKVLYYVDYNFGNDPFGQAFAALGITPTVASSYSDFESDLSSGSWDLVVLLNQGYEDSTWETPLVNYVDGGGHAIVASWADPQDVAAAFGATYTGNNDQSPITQTVSSPIWNGVSNPFDLFNPGWGTWSTGLKATTGQSIGTFPNGDGGIVVGNGGRTILNGFLENTATDPAQGLQLAENEIAATLITIKGDYYSVSVNAGDNLTINTTTPGATTASGLQFANDFYPALDLYDPSGSLVASAAGNAGDGRNSVLTYTALTTGTYYVRVSGANGTSGEYTVSVNGATGGYTFDVTSTTPAAGADVGSQVSTMTVAFSDSVLISSVSTSNFTIDGNPATGFTAIDSHDVSFSFPTTANGVHNVSISGLTSIHGTVLTPDNFSFTTDDVPPVVVSSSIANGAVLAPGNVTEVITFSKPIQPSSVSTTDISLLGEIRDVSYTPTISFDSTDTVLTLSYSNLPTDAYQFTLEAGPANFTSLAGVPLQNNYVINFTIPAGTSTLSGLQPVLPLGSLVYQSTVDNVLVTPTDTDTYDLTIDPQQTISALVTPVTSSLTATVELVSPTGNVLGTATSPEPGEPALLPAVQSSKGGAYQILVFGGVGEYTVQATLNALVDPATYGGSTNTSIASATPIDPYANKFIGQDNRTAVLGRLSGGGGGLFSTDRYTQGLYSVNAATGAATLIGPLSDFTSLSGMAIDPSSGTTYISDVFDPKSEEWSLATIDRTTGQETIIGPQYDPVFGEYDANIHALVDVKGTLYGFSFTRGLGTMNTSNGEFTPLLSTDSMPEPIENAAIDPSTGTVYGIGENSADIYTINVNTATATLVGSSGTGFSFVMGLAFTEGTLYSLGYQGLSRDNPLYKIDPTTGAGTLIGPNGMEYEPDAMTSPPTLGVPGNETQATYSFSLNQGESATIALESLNGKNGSFTLYDDHGNVLGLSSPGATNYTAGLNNLVAQNDGTYYVQVTGDPGLQFNLVVTRGADFTTQPHTTLATAQDITATEQSGVPDTGGALGYLSSTKGTDFYSVNANVGDNLHFATTTPAGGPNEFVNNLYPELLLYDPNGNLVAIANGNAADGRNSVIDFTVPDGDAGKWTIEVTGSPDSPTLTAGEYGLLVTGATGTLSPFEVSSTVPATNALLQPPTTITVTFNDPVLIASLTPGELEVNGVPATAVTDVSANTVSWTVDPTSYPTGVDLPNWVTIGADGAGDQVTDVSGQTLTPYSYTFYTTNVPPTVVSSSVNNQVFSPAPANVTETVTFSQPMDTSFTTASSFDLLGKYRNVQYAAASFSWDHTGKVLTINFTNLPDDTYTLTLLSSGIESSVGIPLASNYVANFAVANGTTAFATPLTALPPLGDLIYTGTNTHVLVTSTDVDDLTLPLNAGGTLTLIGTPTTSALQLTITVLDPSNNVVATATAPAAGQNSVIETAPVATTGTYTIKVGDAGGNVGLYSIQAYLNSYVKQGNSNGTIGTAQDLTSSSYVLGSGNAVRLGVVDPNPPSQDTQNYYSFDLTQGQTATIVAESLNNKGLQITLVDGSGKVLATGVGGSTNVSQSIQNYVASSTGKYYIEITGDPGDQYSLVVTRGAAFSVQDHHTYSTAQNLTGTNGVLGYLAPPTPLLYTLDDQLSGSANPIWATDPTTGAFIPPSINAPGSPLNNPYGLNLAYDGTDLYYNNGADRGDNTIYKLNPTTGAVLASGIPSGAPLFTGLAYLDGKLYGIAGFHPTIYVIDPNTFQVISTFSTNIANTNVVGLAGDPDRDVLWAVTQPYTTNGDIDEINPNTGNVIASAPDNHLGSVQDIAYADGQLIVSDSVSFGPGGSYLDYYDPNTLAFIKRLPVATQGYVSGLGGDGLGGPAKDDWYTINVQAGQALYLQSSTPSDQGGQFPNTASLEMELYDTFGNLVAVGTKVADGRNEALFYNAPVTGQYHIRVHEDPGGEGEYYLSVNTAQYQSGDISGRVYNDLNGSGSFVPGDPGLDNWEVDVYDSSDNFVASQLTSGGGNFNIAGLAPGTYTISEVHQSGWTQTQPVAPYTYTVTVTAGQTSGGYDFGNFQNISISGETFNDLNGNGNHDPGEPGLTGWTVDLYDANNNLVATTVTDVNGDYSFTNIGPGTYTVQEKLQTGWIQTAPASPGTYAITATSGQDSTGLLFGNYQLVTYSGTVYNDLNGSGVIAPGDPGLPGWTVELLDSQGNILATTTSAFDGSYAFANLTYGVYTIEEVTPSGWYQTEPQNPFVYTVTATSGASHSGLNFGNFQAVNVTGEVYNDLNGNGNLDPGEPGLLGWTVLLLDPAGNTVASTTSDANGDYEFDNLFPGTFTVEEILQSGWVQTQPVNPNYYSITTSSGTNIAGETFGNFKAVSVSGNVYNDLNGNGLHDSGEPGLQGWTVQLENSSGTVIASVLSDVNGNYTFTGVGGGTYEVAEVVQINWVQTQPLYPTVYSFTSRSGTNLLALNFGDHASPALTPSAVIDNGQPGYSETGSWSTVVGGFNGTNRVAKTVQAGGPPSTATWNFSSISPATYDVYVTFAGKSGYSEAVPYTVYNGSTELGTVDVNQSILVTQSQGLTQGSYGGVGWLELGAFTISSTDIQVVLSNLATGNFVDADGVLLVPQGGGQGRGVSGPATVGPNSAVGANSTNSSVSIGTFNFNSTAPSTNGNGQQSQVISLSGVSQPAALSVSYNQGSQPVVNQSSLSLVDAVLGLGTSASNSTSNGNGNSSDDAITALAQSLISSNKNS